MRTSGAILFASIIFIAGCSLINSEEKISDKLIGSWEQVPIINEENGLKVIYRYDFTDINSYERTEIHYDLEDNFLGYRLYEDGDYSLRGDKLIMIPGRVIFSENEEIYQTIEELIAEGESNGVGGIEYRTDFTNDDLRVTLFFECPDFALCVEPPVLNKIPDSNTDLF